MSISRAQLLADVEAFLEAYAMTASSFGRSAVNDVALLHRLRSGGDVRLETADRIRAFMQTYSASCARKPKKSTAARTG